MMAFRCRCREHDPPLPCTTCLGSSCPRQWPLPPTPATAAGAQRPGRACAVPPHFDVPTMARVGGLAQLAATLRQPLAVVADDAGHRGSSVHAPSLESCWGEGGRALGKFGDGASWRTVDGRTRRRGRWYGGQRARGVGSPFTAAPMGNDNKAMAAGVDRMMIGTRKKSCFP